MSLVALCPAPWTVSARPCEDAPMSSSPKLSQGIEHATLVSAHDRAPIPTLRAPPHGASRGGVIVVQEIFGLTTHIADMCAYFADAGFDTLAPSLFARIDPQFHAELDEDGLAKGRAAVAATPWPQAIGDIAAAFAALAAPRFIVGFCYGGSAAWRAACTLDGLAGAACFYGRLIVDMIDMRPRAPTQLHFGRNDPSIPLADIDKIKAARPEAECYLYDAGHGFCRRGSHDFSEQARDLALDRTLKFFSAHGNHS